MSFNLRPKNIAVLGGATGIGYATALQLLKNQAQHIILASRKLDSLEKAKKSLVEQNPDYADKIKVIALDISDVSSHEEKILEMQKMLPEGCQLDGMVLSSGVNFDGSNWKRFNISESDWDKVMSVNLKGTFFMMRNFANYLNSHKIKGNICIVSSISAHRDLLSVYQVSKSAISGIVHAYGKYLCERGVILNCVEPGVTDTPMMPHLKAYTDGIRPGKPFVDNSIKRVIRPEEIAEIICFLMSELGETMSGTCLMASGGNKGLAR